MTAYVDTATAYSLAAMVQGRHPAEIEVEVLKAQLADCRADLARAVEARKAAASVVLRAWREIRGSQDIAAPRRRRGP